VGFFAIFGCGAHFKSELRWHGYRPGQPANRNC